MLPESVCRKFIQQLSSALKVATIKGNGLFETFFLIRIFYFQYLRSENISHMDLKPQNILLNGKVLKLADFGFAQHLSPGMFARIMIFKVIYLIWNYSPRSNQNYYSRKSLVHGPGDGIGKKI